MGEREAGYAVDFEGGIAFGRVLPAGAGGPPGGAAGWG